MITILLSIQNYSSSFFALQQNVKCIKEPQNYNKTDYRNLSIMVTFGPDQQVSTIQDKNASLYKIIYANSQEGVTNSYFMSLL